MIIVRFVEIKWTIANFIINKGENNLKKKISKAKFSNFVPYGTYKCPICGHDLETSFLDYCPGGIAEEKNNCTNCNYYYYFYYGVYELSFGKYNFTWHFSELNDNRLAQINKSIKNSLYSAHRNYLHGRRKNYKGK